MALRVGVDTGGTFTDVCLYDEETNTIRVGKVSSTPSDPGLAIREGVAKVADADAGDGTALSQIAYFAHGTTVATNALLQERGVKTGLITTQGFRDLLELGRQRRPKLYDLFARKPTAIVSRDLRMEVSERIDYEGNVVTPLDEGEVRAAARHLAAGGVKAVAVCYLYSFVNPVHEQRTREILEEELPGVFLSISSDVLPEFREFERLSTVVINGFIGPVMESYLSRLRVGLAEDGIAVAPHVTQSNGGVMSFRTAERLPVRTALSGPSTGVVGAARLSALSGVDDIVTFDMGGTSTDVALVNDARPASANGMELDGRPIRTPMLDINTVGAGGGSIAWIDEGGHLKVGPQSAGADPGPACYGRSNTEPTVTDANVVLGILNQETLLGGTMPIDASLSFAAMERLASRLGMTTEDTAQGIISVVTANMARAIRVISVQRGYDPRRYWLVAFGGAGPLHSGRLARELGMRGTLVPQRPGALSALGMLMTDLRADHTVTAVTRAVPEQLGRMGGIVGGLRERATTWFAEEKTGDARVELVLDMRYVGQNYELGIPAEATPDSAAWLDTVVQRFHDTHRGRYGYANEGAPVEIVTYRLESIAAVPTASFPRFEPGPADASGSVIGVRSVYLPEFGERRDVQLHDRARLTAGAVIAGPAVIEQYDTTCFVLPDETAHVDEYLMIHISRA